MAATNSPAVEPEIWVAVFEHDGNNEREFGPAGPFIFETYVRDATREAAQARADCPAGRLCGAARLARVVFDETDEGGPYVLVASFDGVDRERGPLVWEHCLHDPARHTREAMRRSASSLEHRYGATRIARLVFD